jgi:hypothetical protein
MKRNPLLDTIPEKKLDPTASTIDEIMRDRGICRGAASEIRNLNISTGAWVEVWKKINGRVVRAYRLAKKR